MTDRQSHARTDTCKIPKPGDTKDLIQAPASLHQPRLQHSGMRVSLGFGALLFSESRGLTPSCRLHSKSYMLLLCPSMLLRSSCVADKSSRSPHPRSADVCMHPSIPPSIRSYIEGSEKCMQPYILKFLPLQRW